MRHLVGIVLAIVMAGVLFFAAGWGYIRLLRLSSPAVPLSRLPAGGGSLLSDHSALAALIAVAGTGMLAGILIAAPRISPLAAGLPGLLLLGWTALYLVSVRHAVDLIPLRSYAYGAGFEAMLLDGILTMARHRPAGGCQLRTELGGTLCVREQSRHAGHYHARQPA